MASVHCKTASDAYFHHWQSARDYITIPASILSTQNAIQMPAELQMQSSGNIQQMGYQGVSATMSALQEPFPYSNYVQQATSLPKEDSSVFRPGQSAPSSYSTASIPIQSSVAPNHISPSASDGQGSTSSRISQTFGVPISNDKTSTRNTTQQKSSEKSPHVFTSVCLILSQI